MAVQDVDGQKVYDLKMSKDLVAGTKPGADGKNGEAGSITIIGEPGKDGADGKNTSANITVKDGKMDLMVQMESHVLFTKMKTVQIMKLQPWMMV